MVKPAVLNRRHAAANESRWRGLLLFLCCLASGGLVAVAGVLIALMQFQARLVQADANFTSGDIVFLAETDKEMDLEYEGIGKLLVRTDKLKGQIVAMRGEVDYRVDHICMSLDLLPDKHALCRTFLQTIPFNAGAAPVTEASITPKDADGIKVASTPALPLADIQPHLTDVLVANLKVRLGLNDSRTELLNLHAESFREIAAMNVTLKFETERRFFRANGEAVSRCNRIVRYAKAMAKYRTFNVDDCQFKILETAYAPSLLPESEPTEEAPRQAPEPQGKATGPAAAVLEDAKPNPASAGAGDGQSADTAPPDDQDGLQTFYIGGDLQESATPNDTRQRTFDLVSQYLFYDWLSFGLLETVIKSPNDFIAFSLVAVCGMLGGLLKLIMAHSKTGRLSGGREFMTTLLLGLICALIVYALFRAGFLALTTQSSASADDTISPFVIALLALGSGFVSDRAIETFRGWIDSKIGDGADDQIDRWAFGLAGAMAVKGFTSEMLATRLSVSQELVEDWMIEKTAVDSDYQDWIHVVLETPRRHLFTIDPPQEQTG